MLPALERQKQHPPLCLGGFASERYKETTHGWMLKVDLLEWYIGYL